MKLHSSHPELHSKPLSLCYPHMTVTIVLIVSVTVAAAAAAAYEGKLPGVRHVIAPSWAAASLKELAQARLLSAEASPEQYLEVTGGVGLVLQDTQQELCLGDTPQVAWHSYHSPSLMS